MRIILDAPNVDFWNANADYYNFQDMLGMDDNFDLADSIIYAMDYGEVKDDKVVDSHNGIKITIETNM